MGLYSAALIRILKTISLRGAKVMENMTMLLSENGVITHILPAGGLIDHGFYSFSPTFF